MKTGLLALALVVTLAANARAAIAVDGHSSGQATGFTTTVSHTIASTTNAVLWVHIHLNTGTDAVSGVTYNGVAMTRSVAVDYGATYGYVYCLLAASLTAGTHNIVATNTGFVQQWVIAESYTGANQICTPDSVNTPPGTSVFVNSQTLTTTAVASPVWLSYGVFTTTTDPSAGTGATKRGSVTDGTRYMSYFDSNGDLTGGGAKSIQATSSGTPNWSGIAFSFGEAGAAAPVVAPKGSLSILP